MRRCLCQQSTQGKAQTKDAPQPILLPVHLAANDREERLAVDQDLNSVLLHDLVELPRLVNVLEMVRQPSAALVPHTDTNQLRCRTLEQVA